MTPVILGIIVGLAYGALVGFVKYAALWKNIIKSDKNIAMGAVYLRMGIGYAINIAALFLVFFTREIVPFNFMATLIAVAVALSLMGKLVPMTEITMHVKDVNDFKENK